MSNEIFIVLIAIAALAVYFLLIHKPVVVAPIAAPIMSAPGVSPMTGQVLSGPLPSPPARTINSTVPQAPLTRSGTGFVGGVLNNVPLGHAADTLAGGIVAATAGGIGLVGGVTSGILSHVPIAGKPAAAIVNGVTGGVSSAIKSIGSWF